MIKNERQYRITRTQARKFHEALRTLEDRTDHSMPEILHRAQIDAIRSQLRDLEAEIADYEGTAQGTPVVFDLTSLDALPEALIRARIAARLTQRELADRLGLKEQQIQRYEATNYATADLQRIGEVIDALGIEISERVVLPGRVTQRE
jgi:hypothetical protein